MSEAELIGRPAAFRPLLAAYRLRLGLAANRLGAQPETWGVGNVICVADEERILTGEDAEFRLAPYPFPGLRSFAPDEGDLFFGRERSVTKLRDLLQAQRVVVICGGSGSGKSSLVRAGLLPFLNTRQRIRGRDGNWYRAEFRPRTDPIRGLAEALADQLLMPFLALDKPGMAEAMGLPPDCAGEAARARLRESVHARFLEARKEGRDAVLATLLDFAQVRLDALDRLATDGLRVPGPSLLLLLDQFEEVFRPEVSAEARATLLDLIVDLHAWMGARPGEGGLFLTVTMRSEELHRCTEHRGLSDVVTRSLYLLELLDPADADDAADLHRAMVQPARNVFEDWGLEFDKDNPDAPFARGVPAWLLSGVELLSTELEHRPDQLPLLQHALQAMWHAAMRDWSRPDFRGDWLEVQKEHLPGQPAGIVAGSPDLGACLRARADRAAVRGAERFAIVAGTPPGSGDAALQAAFRALARRDDRGNWARRFAERAEMEAFLAAEPSLAGVEAGRRWAGLREALHVFLLRGYLSGGENRPYDISHEALIRNWPQFQTWLRDPGEIAYALGRVLEEVEPEEFAKLDDAAKMEAIRADMSRRVRLRTEGGELPARWGADQIAPLLLRPQTRARWGGNEKTALRRVAELAGEADDARERAAAAKRAEEVRIVEDETKRRWTRTLQLGGAAISVVVFLAVVGVWISNIQATARVFEANAEVLRISANADRALAEVEAERRTTEAAIATATARALAAHGLIGAMQSSEVARWAPGVRERGALHALEMLSASGGNAPKPQVLRELASWRWDAGMRGMLGQQLALRVITLPEQPMQSPACLTIGDRSGTSEPISPTLGTAQAAPQVRLVAVGQDGGIGLRAEAGNSIPHDIQVPTPTGARVCLARDGTALTISAPRDRIPVVYELTWLRCDQPATCQGGSGWEVISRRIEPPLALIENIRDSRLACVRGIGIVPGAVGAVPLLNVDFTGEESSDACTNAPRVQSFRASYVPGIATPRPIDPPAGPAISFGSCEQFNSHASSPNLGPHLRCSVAAPRRTEPVELLLLPDRNSPSPDRRWFLQMSTWYEAAPLSIVPVIAPAIARAGFDEHGDLVLSDADGSFYRLIASRRRVLAALCARATEGSIDEANDVGMVMTEAERRAGKPAGCL